MNLRTKKILMSVTGVLLTGICVGFFKRAALGVDPYQTMMSGLNALVPISFGTLFLLVQLGLLLFIFFTDRHYIGLATLINMTLLGYVAEWTLAGATRLLPDLSLAGRFVMLIVSLPLLCLAGALYFSADLGVSAYDAVALIIVNKWKLGAFRYVRIFTDLACVIIGCILFVIAGGNWREIPTIAGLGTILTAFCMGPLVDFFRRHLTDPMVR